MSEFLKYFPLVKVDEAAHLAYGLVTCEDTDSDGESCVYDDPSKPMDAKRAYKTWSEECLKSTTAAGQEPSLGNIRQMHQLLLGGKAVKLDFDDANRQVSIGVEPADDETWQKIRKGMYRGFSQGGNYAWRDPAGASPRQYAPTIGEVSLVDNPALKRATFSYVKADGSMEVVKFATAPGLGKARKYLVPEGEHLPYTDESGKPDHRLMGDAWAALHGEWRGNKYEGADKEKAIARLREVYRSEGIEPPGGKATRAEIEKLRALAAELEKEISSEEGTTMTPEQITKCAAALGISEEELKKQLEGASLEKAKKGLAALQGHLEKAVEHHEQMHKAHKALGAMHEAHAALLGKCTKALNAVMGSEEDGEKADKPAVTKADESKGEFVKAADVDAIVAKAIEAAKLAQPAKDEADKVTLVGRTGGELDKGAENPADPFGGN